VFVERLWRSVKYEDVYIKDYERVPDLEAGLTADYEFYDEERPHPVAGLSHSGRGLPRRARAGESWGRSITNPGPRAVQFPGTTSRA